MSRSKRIGGLTTIDRGQRVSVRTIEACCKINLGLHVLRRRDDGFHEIETVLYPLPWCDRVSFEPADDHAFTCSDPHLPVDNSNLCVKARLAFEERFGSAAPVKIHLDKCVPYGSGLGGGSSDAAAVLRYLAGQAGIDPTDEHLVELAGEVGSDVPFFLLDGPAHGTGRGEKLERIEVDFPYHVVIATPGVSVSTGDAYAGILPRDLSARPSAGIGLAALITEGNAGLWRSSLVFGAFPQLERIKSTIYGAGADYASLSGSGSAIYGLFSDGDSAAAAAHVLLQRQISGWVGDSVSGRAFQVAIR